MDGSEGDTERMHSRNEGTTRQMQRSRNEDMLPVYAQFAAALVPRMKRCRLSWSLRICGSLGRNAAARIDIFRPP